MYRYGFIYFWCKLQSICERKLRVFKGELFFYRCCLRMVNSLVQTCLTSHRLSHLYFYSFDIIHIVFTDTFAVFAE